MKEKKVKKVYPSSYTKLKAKHDALVKEIDLLKYDVERLNKLLYGKKK